MRDLTNSQQGSTKKTQLSQTELLQNFLISLYCIKFLITRSKYKFFTKLAVGEAMAKSLLHWTPGLKVRIRDLVAGSFCCILGQNMFLPQ